MSKTCPIALDEINIRNIEQLKILNKICLPVRYPESFYQKVTHRYKKEHSRYAFFNDILVGAVSFRVDVEDDTEKIYLMTICVLPPYRRLGIGKILLEYVLDYMSNNKNISEAYLNVQINNDAAIGFYHNFGFQTTGKHQNYYTKIEPSDALVLTKLRDD
eukprot:TRINITY_DN11419_c0_g2_i1.p1 TRINITY_DN11419_c0_g2~~TRINITY_DN11419_c0_g2_i1.p1  ORF type:complete len:178 (-),score=31.51 TRINITY_DN11419_c0_g2_i1:22-501(-)